MKRFITEKLVNWKNAPNRKPLLLKGARQVGKTYTLKEFGKNNFRRTHYINFEEDKNLSGIFETDLKPQRIINELSFHCDTAINIKEDIIIFDEIQDCPNALTSLKYFAEGLNELAICAAGSHLGVETVTGSFPVGRVDILKMFPLCFEEFLSGIEDSRSTDFMKSFAPGDLTPDIVHNHLWEKLKIYFVTGGLPAIVSTYKERADNLYDALTETRKQQKILVDSYMGDFAKHSGKNNALHIERMFRNVPKQLAREINSSVKRFRFKDIIPGKNRYTQLEGPIDWLCKAGFVYKCHIADKAAIPLKAYCKENIFKLYLFDIGILGCLAEIPLKSIMNYNYGSYKGFFAENFVATEFIAKGFEELVSWNENTAEIEFLGTIGEKIIPVEVKAGRVLHSKSLKVFTDKYNPEYKVKISGKKFFHDPQSHFINYPLYMSYKFPLGIPTVHF